MSQDKITNRIIKTENVNWKDFQFIQHPGFKELTAESMSKLKQSILKNNFIESFKVWQSGKNLFCLDGYHRCKAFRELEAEGYKINKTFPANFINCKNKKEAAKLVLIYSSQYAKITKEGVDEFLTFHNLNLNLIQDEIDLPDLQLTGLAIDGNKEVKIIEEQIKPYKKTHILLSFHPDKLIELQPLIEKIMLIEGIEYEQSSN